MDFFKIPQTPSGPRSKTILPRGGLEEPPERPIVPPSPGAWLDVEELIQENLPQSQGHPEGWGYLAPGKETSKQKTRHIELLAGVGLKKEELKKIYGYAGEKWNNYIENLTCIQKAIARQCRAGYMNKKYAATSRERKGMDLELCRKKLEEKKRQGDIDLANNRQLSIRLQQVVSKRKDLEQAVLERNLKELAPVNEGFLSMGEFLDWFP